MVDTSKLTRAEKTLLNTFASTFRSSECDWARVGGMIAKKGYTPRVKKELKKWGQVTLTKNKENFFIAVTRATR